MPGLVNQQDTITTAAIAAIVAQEVTAATGTFSFDETNAAEQTVFTNAPGAVRHVGAILVDTSNVTQNTTFRIYTQIDGVNYRLVYELAFVAAASDGLNLGEYTFYRSFRLTAQCGGGGGGAVNVPWAVV